MSFVDIFWTQTRTIFYRLTLIINWNFLCFIMGKSLIGSFLLGLAKNNTVQLIWIWTHDWYNYRNYFNMKFIYNYHNNVLKCGFFRLISPSCSFFLASKSLKLPSKQICFTPSSKDKICLKLRKLPTTGIFMNYKFIFYCHADENL